MSDASTLHVPSQSSTFAALRRFFFAEEIPFGMALVRILLPWVLLINVIPRWEFCRELYSSDGAPSPLADNFGNHGLLMEVSGPVAVGLFTAMIFLLVTSSIGWYTRLSLIASTLLYTYFGLMDSMSTLTKYTVIATHVLLLLSVSPCGEIWSVDRWLRGRTPRNPLACGPGVPLPRFPIWSQRLTQLLLAIIYFGASVTKLHTPTYFSGDQLMYWMMTHLNNSHPLGDYMSQYPVLIIVCSYIAVVWEMTFIVAVWQTRMRIPFLLVGVLFHVMTTFTLGLVVFPLVMITIYLAFLTEDDVRWVMAKYRRIERRIGWLARRRKAAALHVVPVTGAVTPRLPWPRLAMPCAFALALCLVSLGGVEAEYWYDPYALRGPDGPRALKEISSEEVERLLTDGVPLRESDKFLAFDLGTVMVGEHLLNRRKVFHHGERVLAQVCLNPPHDDLWVECNLFDAKTKPVEREDGPPVDELVPDKLISRTGQVVTREMLRSSFVYFFDESLEPGDYFFVIRSKGEEITRKKFSLLPRVKAAAAN